MCIRDRDVLDNTVSVEVRLAPSVAATALGALEYLTSYPYGCVEQTMNSFLPNIIVSKTLHELGIEMPEALKDLPKMVEAGLARIYRYQHWEGGWGWWEYDKPNARMTAYAVYGLNLAKKAGFQVDDGVLMRGKKALGGFQMCIRDRYGGARITAGSRWLNTGSRSMKSQSPLTRECM